MASFVTASTAFRVAPSDSILASVSSLTDSISARTSSICCRSSSLSPDITTRPSAAPAGATISCFGIRCCQPQTRCLRGAPRCRRGGEIDITNAGTHMSPYLVDTSPHTQIYIYITRGAAPCCHRPHTQTNRSFVTSLRSVPLLSRAPAAPFIRLTPRGQEHLQPSYITQEH